jgi:hypothetical protein
MFFLPLLLSLFSSPAPAIEIRSKLNPPRCLAVWGDVHQLGNQPFVASCDGELEEDFALSPTALDPDTFKIKATSSGHCLGFRILKEGEAIEEETCSDLRSQEFRFERRSDQSYRLHVLESPDLCLEPTPLAKLGAAHLVMEPCKPATESSEQEFKIDDFNSPAQNLGDLRQIDSGTRISQSGCGYVNLKNDFPRVRNQGKTSWCFAAAAADLLGYRLKKEFSFFDIGRLYQRESEGRSTHYSKTDVGNLGHALKYAMKYGVCRESDLHSEGFHLGFHLAEGPRKSDLKEMLLYLEGHREVLEKSDIESPEFQNAYEVIHSNFPKTSAQRLKTAASSSPARDADVNFVDALIADQCRAETIPEIPVETFENFTTQDPLDLIDRQLNVKNPVAIVLTAAYFADAINADGEGDSNSDNQETNHAVVVMGRGFNPQTGDCDYLIRNSWGLTHYNFDNPIQSSGGYLWIPERTLTKAVDEVTWLK